MGSRREIAGVEGEILWLLTLVCRANSSFALIFGLAHVVVFRILCRRNRSADANKCVAGQAALRLVHGAGTRLLHVLIRTRGRLRFLVICFTTTDGRKNTLHEGLFAESIEENANCQESEEGN